jgi:hypothetical protein
VAHVDFDIRCSDRSQMTVNVLIDVGRNRDGSRKCKRTLDQVGQSNCQNPEQVISRESLATKQVAGGPTYVRSQ